MANKATSRLPIGLILALYPAQRSLPKDNVVDLTLVCLLLKNLRPSVHHADQDKALGGWEPLSKATKLLSENGATANNWIIHTPVWYVKPQALSFFWPLLLALF